MNLEKLKSIPILQVAQSLGLSFDKNKKTRCFNLAAHKNNDSHASLSFDLSENKFKCFSCGVSGSNIDLYMGYRGVDFKTATNEISKAFLPGQGYQGPNGKKMEGKQQREYFINAIKKWNLEKKTFDELYDYGPYIKVRFRDPGNRREKLDLFFTKTKYDKFAKGRNCTPVLYNQGDLEQRERVIVCYVEGEGCVDILKSLGFLATTAGSAIISIKTLTQAMLSTLEGRDVVIFPDNDKPGLQLVTDLSSILQDKVNSIKKADIKTIWKECFAEEMPQKGDVKDFILKYKELHADNDGALKGIIDTMINNAKVVNASAQKYVVVGNNGNGEILEKYFNGKRFVAPLLTADILSENGFLYIDKFFYHYIDGYWRVTDVDYIAQMAKIKLENLSKISYINETVNDIKLSILVNESIKLNNKPELINVKNGMYDFINRRLIKHDPAYLSSIRINASFDQNEQCPRFEKFLSETISKEDSNILQEIFGYSLIPDNRFEKAVILTGSGSNGKSVTLNILMKLVGMENVSKVSLIELGDRFKTVLLHNKLINVCSDLGNQAMKNTEVFKMITSGDPITVERKHENAFSFQPYVKLLFSCNELPKSIDRSFAYYRRLILIPYLNSFTGKNQDKALKAKLESEINGILNWSLEGLSRLFKNQGFSESKTSNEMLQYYKLDNDNVLQFTNESCVIDDGLIVDKTTLYSKYKGYCEDNGLRPLSQRRFNKDLIEKNNSVFETRNHFSNKRAWKGIGLDDN